MRPGRTGMHPWLDALVRLSRAPVASIACIRGRARGAGSEFVLACDIRFASREKAVLGQFEVGIGAVPGGGPMARLPRLVGRGRALEILLGAKAENSRRLLRQNRPFSWTVQAEPASAACANVRAIWAASCLEFG